MARVASRWEKADAFRRLRNVISTRPAAAHAVALLITLYAGMLRLDAFVGKYGALDHPAWARIATQEIAPLAARVRPSSVVWWRDESPYVGGDPINYLKYAREMQSFYQGHVREPVFLAMTRAGLWSLNDQDAGVSLASAAGSTLAVFGTYLLGAALLSRLTGLLAALVMAVEFEAIFWATDGWRDDTFTATVVFAAWALLRLRARPSFPNALLAGVLCGVACLTRITALSFIVPALIWLVADGNTPARREKMRYSAAALLAVAVIVAPYLINSWIVTGDPLIAINYHTSYYRFAEGQPIDQPMGAAEYLRTKFANRPVVTLDTGMIGLFVQPFATKWNGLEHWMPGLGAALAWLAVAGLAALPFTGAGRLMVVILLTSLLPYIFTWNLGGGGEWRFTMHAYPFYIVAAAFAVAGAARGLRALVAQRAWPREITRPLLKRVAAVAAVAIIGVVAYFGLPWFAIKEVVAHGEAVSVDTGPRDRVFYRTGWSPPHLDGVTIRVLRGERGVIHLPLPSKRDYDLVLRIDPIDPARQERVSVLFNRHLIGVPRLSWDPERVGSYRMTARAHMVNEGSNELTIIPSALVTAGSAGPRFGWLDPDDQVGLRLWYVRILPSP